MPFEVTFKEQVGLTTKRFDIQGVYVTIVYFRNSGNSGFDWKDKVRSPITIHAGEGRLILLAERWIGPKGVLVSASEDRRNVVIEYGYMEPGQSFAIAIAHEARATKTEEGSYEVPTQDRLTVTGDIRGQPLLVSPREKTELPHPLYAMKSFYTAFALTGMLVAATRMRLHRIFSSKVYRKGFFRPQAASPGHRARIISSCILYFAFTAIGYLLNSIMPDTHTNWTFWALGITACYLIMLITLPIAADTYELWAIRRARSIDNP